MIFIISILVLIFLIVTSGNRYHQSQQTKAIIRIIKGPTRTPLTLGWRDPLLRRFLFVVATLIGIVILVSLAGH